MKFDQTTTYSIFAVLLVILLGGTMTSDMPTPVAVPVAVGLVVFGVATLYLGIRHGEYRATR